MKNIIYISVLIFNTTFGQVSLPGLFGFYGAQSVTLAGASGTVLGFDNTQINPASLIIVDPQVRLSMLKYPANIYAQSASYVNILKNAKYSISLRRTNYGTFDKINTDGVTDGYYTASDMWIATDYAKTKNDLAYGVEGGIFLSNLESYNAVAMVFSAGAIYDLNKYDLRLGFSIVNIGFFLNQFTEYRDKLPARTAISVGKKLKYLPLQLNGDASYGFSNKKVNVRIGGIFQLPYNFNFMFGINSDNLDQATEYKNIKSLLGGTGIGLSYLGSQYELVFGGYSYGTGGWIYGTTFSYRLKAIDY